MNDNLVISLSLDFPARAKPSYEGSEPGCMSKDNKFLTYFPILLLWHDSSQFYDHLFEFM